MKKILLSFLACLCVACVTTDPRVTERRAEIHSLKEQLRVEPNNPEVHFYLATHYLDLANHTGARSDLDQAVHHYERVVEYVPGHAASLGSLYNIHYGDTVYGRDGALQRLQQTFAQLPEDLRKEVNAPSLAHYMQTRILQLMRDEPDPAPLRALLTQAIAEQPYSAPPYSLLSAMHIEDRRFPLALALLHQAVERIDDSPLLYQALADTYQRQAIDRGCRHESDENLRQAVKYYQGAVSLQPDDAELRGELGAAFWDLGMFPLALNETEQAWALEPNGFWPIRMSQLYLLMGDPVQAQHWLAEVGDAQHEYPLSYLELLMYHGAWGDAVQRYQETLRDKDELTTYQYLYAELARQEAGIDQVSWQNKPVVPTNEWQTMLWKFGQDQVDGEALLAGASNICERTESHFLIGYQHYRAGEHQAAQQAFASAMQERAYTYVEYFLALYFYGLLD